MSNQVIPAGSINPNATIAPGVVVIESLTPGAISGVPTNLIGLGGTSTWGPVDSQVLVSGPVDYANQLGSVVNEQYDMGTALSAAALQGTVASYVCVRVTDGTDTMSSTRLLDTAVSPVTGVILTAKYSGTTGNFLQANVTPGIAAGTYNVSIARPGYVAELFSNIGGSGNEFWQNVVTAINNGQSGVRGPSNLVVASAGDGVTAVAVTSGGSAYATTPSVSFTGGGGGTGAAATAVLGYAISSVTVGTPGSYSATPTISTSGAGSGATLSAVMGGLSGTYATSGSGYAPADVLTVAGGAFGVAATLTVATTRLVTTILNAAGTGYAAGDTITLAGGTSSTKAVVTVTATKLISAAILSGGSGYNTGDLITLAGGTHPTVAILNVDTVDGGGAVTAFTIAINGAYTVNTSSFTQASTSGGGTGFTANTAVWGVGTASVTTAGSYTVNTTTFTQFSTTGAGTGATFHNSLYGVNTVTVGTAGTYTVLPSSPFSVTGGSGTGATFTMLWSIASITVGAAGSGYTAGTTVVISGSGGGAATLVLAATGAVISVTVTDEGTGYTVAPSVVFTGGSGTGAAATATIESALAPSTSDNPYLFAGGTNGNSGVTSTTLLGADGEAPTGMYVLRNSNVSLFALVDADDADTYSDQDTFASQIGAQVILVGEPGQTVSQGITAKNGASISDNYAVFLLGDWCNFIDTNNGGIVRLISPQGFYGGLMGNLSPEQSPLNKQIFGIVSTQKTSQNQVYSNTDIVNAMQNGIEIITNPIPRGNVFGCATGKSAGINLTTNNVCIQRMANFLGLSLSGSGILSQFIGDLQMPSVRTSAKNCLLSFLKNLEANQLIQDSLVVLGTSNNPEDQVELGFMQANVTVQLYSVIIVFLIDLEVGTSSIQSTNPA